MARALALVPEIFTDEKKLKFNNKKFDKSFQIPDEKIIVDNYEKEVRALKKHLKMFDTLVTGDPPVDTDLPIIKRGTREKTSLPVTPSKRLEKPAPDVKSKNTKIRFQTKVEYHDKFKFERVGLPKAKSRIQPRSKEAEDIKSASLRASSNEVLHLKEKLKSLSTELLNLRHHLVENHSFTEQKNDFKMTAPETEKSDKKSSDKKSSKPPSISAVNHPGDLIQLSGPLTEDAIIRALQSRFYSGHYWTKIGTVLVSINSFRDVGNPLTLTSVHRKSNHLLQVVEDSLRLQVETGYPQTIILGGDAGSGKTYTSMLLLRHLFDIAGGGPETDAFKHLSAALAVLRSLGTTKTTTNSESSRLGHFLEVQVSDGAVHRTKIHCYFLDQSRVVRPLSSEKNYHIFYQMLSGLSSEERVKLHLEGYSIQNLVYLNQGDVNQNEAQDKSRFKEWKTALSVLGIAFFDVMRVLSATILLGNIHYSEGASLELTMEGNNEIKSVAALLGVSSVALYKGLTVKSRNRRGHMIKTVCDAANANKNRDALVKALYCRTVATIVRRANSLRRINSASLTLSSDSNESVHNQETGSQHSPSTNKNQSSRPSKSLNAFNSGRGFNSEGFIGIVDMFGFETAQVNHLEQLCVNLASETLQHIFNTHIFKSSIDSCRDEGIYCDVDLDYVDSVQCIELIASQKTGLLSLLDAENAEAKPSLETFMQKVQTQHASCSRFFNTSSSPNQFGIIHYRGKVVYDASEFLDCNKDIVPDDIVCIFQKHSCNFGFATHLFASDLKNAMYEGSGPKGLSFRISPPSYSDSHHNNDKLPTFTQDFHTRLDNLLKTLMHSKTHFIRCIKSNDKEEADLFERETVVKQIRALEILETVNLMAGGFPHRLRLKAFNIRYRFFIGCRRLRKTEEGQYEDCRLILESFLKAVDESSFPYISNNWALGKKYIFLSEGARQQLEILRLQSRKNAAITIQSHVRRWLCLKKWPQHKQNMEKKKQHKTTRTNPISRPRPQPIVERVVDSERGNRKLLEQTCQMYGLNMNNIPPIPSSRPYIVIGNIKLGYPQTRIMKQNYPQHSGEAILRCGEAILVIGASPKKGYIMVEHNNAIFHVPFQITELKNIPKVGVNI